LIERDDTWFVGEIAGRIVGTELPAFEAYRKAHSEIHKNEEAIAFGSRLAAMDDQPISQTLTKIEPSTMSDAELAAIVRNGVQTDVRPH
jgi:hypothetical protein